MAKIFGTGRGCFISFNVDTSRSGGFILSLPGGVDQIPDEPRKLGLVITDFSMQQSEVVSHLKCFDGGIYTYAFGNGVGECSVRFMAFLKAGVIAGTSDAKAGKAVPAEGGGFKKVLEMYSRARLSRSKQYATMAMGTSGAKIRGQVVGLSSDTNNTEGNIQAFMLTMKLTDVQEGAAAQ